MPRKGSRKKKLSDRSVRRDVYHQRAKQRGFRARSVFKLEEIDTKHKLIGRGARVLDLGCAPGSWLQYATQRAGPTAKLVGIDLTELPAPIENVRLFVGDINDVDPRDLLGELDGFDVVLSDMAPNTTGIRHVDQARSEVLFELALDTAEATLVVGGHFVAKLFQGPEFQNLIKRCRARFEVVRIIKPQSSRTRSIEQYIVAKQYRG